MLKFKDNLKEANLSKVRGVAKNINIKGKNITVILCSASNSDSKNTNFEEVEEQNVGSAR